MTDGLSFGGLSQAQYLRQLYANQVGLTDLADDSTVGLNALGTLDTGYPASIFGNGLGYGYGMYGYGNDPSQYLNYQRQINEGNAQLQYDMEDAQLRRGADKYHKIGGAAFSTTAAEDVVTRRIGVLQRKIQENEQDAVMTEYEQLCSDIKQKLAEAGYTGVDEQQVKAYAERLYNSTTGKSIATDLEEHGDSSFWLGVKQGAFCGLGQLFTNSTSYKENLEEMTGEDASKAEPFLNKAGRIISTVATTAVLIMALPFLARGGFKATKGTLKVMFSGFRRSGKAVAAAEEKIASKVATSASNPIAKDTREFFTNM